MVLFSFWLGSCDSWEIKIFGLRIKLNKRDFITIYPTRNKTGPGLNRWWLNYLKEDAIFHGLIFKTSF